MTNSMLVNRALNQRNNTAVGRPEDLWQNPVQNLEAVGVAIVDKGYVERLRVCNACPMLKHTFGVPRCGSCGCFIWIKAGFKNLHCPEQKW